MPEIRAPFTSLKSTFDVVAGPTKPIVGVVRLKGKGKPVAGVSGYGYDPATGIQAGVTTDAEGRFRLVGLPKAGAYQVRFEPRPGDPYLGAVVDLTDTEGLAPIAADVELPPGGRAEVALDLDRPVALEPGVRFALREGGRTIGAGVVTATQ